jgi:hypothetical protein
VCRKWWKPLQTTPSRRIYYDPEDDELRLPSYRGFVVRRNTAKNRPDTGMKFVPAYGYSNVWAEFGEYGIRVV